LLDEEYHYMNKLKRNKQMTKLEFILLCGEHNIDPDLALENDNIYQGLFDRDSKKVIKAIREEF
jgi:hypothetical protein